jgi:hypothetical protein
MSRNNNVRFQGNNNSKQTARKPFCKVCFDAKKPAEVYESHWVKDREGKVTCVTLNSQECRYCYKQGHTVKFCPVIAEQNSNKERAERRQKDQERRAIEEEKSKKSKIASTNKFGGGFAALADDSDDDTEKKKQEKPVKEEWPSLSNKPLSAAPQKMVSFASALQKTPIQVEKEREKQNAAVGFTVLTRDNKGSTKIDASQTTAVESSAPASFKPVFIKRIIDWTAESSDEDEDEDEEKYPNVTVRNPAIQSASYCNEEYVDNSAW